MRAADQLSNLAPRLDRQMQRRADQSAGPCRSAPAETAGRHLPSDATAAASKQECFSAVGIEADGRRGVVDLRIAW
jgi:hypothetical protein